MKPSIYRRIRRRPISREAASFRKDSQHEQQFFGETMHEPFFKPVAAGQQSAAVQRKSAEPEKEDKQVRRMPDKKEEEKLHRSADKKEEEVMKKEDKKEEEKIHRVPEKKEEEKVQRTEDKKDEEINKKDAGTTSTQPGNTTSGYISSINGKGQSMSPGMQSFYESRISADFSDVKIHTGKEAAESAKDINAQAYTYGNHIVFANGKYKPETVEGKRLLAHELTHVIQQKPGNKMFRRPGDGKEPEKKPEPAKPAETTPTAAGREKPVPEKDPCAFTGRQKIRFNFDVLRKKILGKEPAIDSFLKKYDFKKTKFQKVQEEKTGSSIKIWMLQIDFFDIPTAAPGITLEGVPVVKGNTTTYNFATSINISRMDTMNPDFCKRVPNPVDRLVLLMAETFYHELIHVRQLIDKNVLPANQTPLSKDYQATVAAVNDSAAAAEKKGVESALTKLLVQGQAAGNVEPTFINDTITYLMNEKFAKQKAGKDFGNILDNKVVANAYAAEVIERIYKFGNGIIDEAKWTLAKDELKQNLKLLYDKADTLVTAATVPAAVPAPATPAGDK